MGIPEPAISLAALVQWYWLEDKAQQAGLASSLAWGIIVNIIRIVATS